jgi:putative nucleotidyltransferase with HDIG domain
MDNDKNQTTGGDPHLEKLKLRELKAFERRIDELPLLPSVVARLVAMDKNADDYFEKVRELATEDPPFAVKLIQLANSASFGLSREITSIESAILLLGVNAVAGLATSMAVTRVFVPANQEQKSLWSHSIEVAVGARVIAEAVPGFRPFADTAYLVGLLHDIGRFIMFEQTSDNLNKVNETHWKTVDALLQAELDVFRFTHSELGYLACKKWHFPELIGRVIQHHHDNFELGQSGLDRKIEHLVFIVELSDLLSVSLLGHPDFRNMDLEARQECIKENVIKPEWAHLPLPPKFLARASEKIWHESRELVTNLGVA